MMLHRRIKSESTILTGGLRLRRNHREDGEKHFFTTDATSTHDAVEQAMKLWCMFWWSDSEAIAIVKRADQCWNISVRQVLAKQSERIRRPKG